MSTKTNIVAGASVRGIVPQTFDDAARIARAAVMAGARPLSTPFGKPDPTQDEQEAAATMIIMAGLELGLPPTQALEVIAMINGRRCIWGDGIPALLWSNGFKIRERFEGDEKTDNFKAICTVVRPDGEEITREFSIADAKRARLWSPTEKVTKRGKNGTNYQADNDSPWFKYWKRMLQMRARGWGGRDGAADVLRGLRVAEEEQDHARQMKDITPAPAVDDLPDIPDDPPEVPDIPDAEEVRQDDEEGHDGFLAMLRAKMADGNPEEIWDEMAEIVGELPRKAREKAEAIYEEFMPQAAE